jgi:hypothetical protein
LVTEALGYLGGVLILVAAGLITARFWEDMALGLRLGLVAAASVLLLAIGTFLGLLAADWLNWQGVDVLLLAGAGTAL